jgi:phosphomannomutase
LDNRVTTEPIITVSGLRGVVGQSLTPEAAARYATAFAHELPPGPIVISRDGRESGARLALVVGAALNAMGRPLFDAAVAATPTTGVLVRTLKAAGGIQISASHNPAQYNGMKLFSAEGRVLPADVGARVLERYRSVLPPDSKWLLEQIERVDVDQLADTTSDHLSLLAPVCEVERIRSRGFRVILDANHGAGSTLGGRLLNELGCDAGVVGMLPDGQFEHPPEPTEANLATVLTQVGKYHADVGFCQDPDADRLAIIDERGRYIGEEKTLALCVDHVLQSQRQGAVVTNCSTSRMSEDLAAKYGAPFYRSKVGEAHVVDLMLARSAVLGGEGNGGVIDPRVGLVRDSFVGMALVLDAMAARGLPVSALADELPQYAIHKTTVAVPAEKVAGALDALQRHFKDAVPDRLDGLRLDWPDRSWLLVRPSNTEPIVRAIAEARTADEAKSLCDQAAALLAS